MSRLRQAMKALNYLNEYQVKVPLLEQLRCQTQRLQEVRVLNIPLLMCYHMKICPQNIKLLLPLYLRRKNYHRLKRRTQIPTGE